MIDIDISEVLSNARENARELDALPSRVARRIGRAVESEKNGHRYTNRTGLAQSTTTMTVTESVDSFEVVADMGAPYASYLNRDDYWSSFSAKLDHAFHDVIVVVKDIGVE